MGAGEVWWHWRGGPREEPTGVRPTGAHGVTQAHTGLLAASRAQTDFAASRSFCRPLDSEWAGRVRWAWLGPQATLMPSFCPDAFWPVSGMTPGPFSSGPRGFLPPGPTGQIPQGGCWSQGPWILRSVWLGVLLPVVYPEKASLSCRSQLLS